MKYLVTKAECKSGNTTVCILHDIDTEDIERMREKLHECVPCERVLLTYEERGDE